MSVLGRNLLAGALQHDGVGASALRTLEWVGQRENLVVCDPSGTGKTMFLEALGQAAVDTGRRVAWFTLESLGVLVRRHRADDCVTRAINRILRADRIVVADVGFLAVSSDDAEGLYRLVDAAYEKRSMALSSNLHSGFDEIVPSPAPPSIVSCTTPTSASPKAKASA